MANARKRDHRPTKHLTPKVLLLVSISLLLLLLLLLLTFFFLASRTSNPDPTLKALNLHHTIQPFDCSNSPQSYPAIANVVEGLKYPFLYALSDLGTLPEHCSDPEGQAIQATDISVTVQEVLEKMRDEGKTGTFVDVGANVGIATFAAAVVGFRVLAFEPVFENLQRICDGVCFNRVGDLVTVFEAVASDRSGI